MMDIARGLAFSHANKVCQLPPPPSNDNHLDGLTAGIHAVPIQQALLHSDPIPEVLPRNNLVDGLCQVDVACDVRQALQLSSKVLQLCQAALRPFAALVVSLQALGALAQLGAHRRKAQVSQLQVDFVC